jgi:hypothetical protein
MWALLQRYNHHQLLLLNCSLVEDLFLLFVFMLILKLWTEVIYFEWSICRPVPQRIASGSCKGENSLQSASSSDAIAFTCLFSQVLENSLQSAKWQ